MKQKITPIVSLSLAFLVFACAGLPRRQKEQAVALKDRIDQTLERVNQLDEAYKSQLGSQEYTSFFKTYAEREDWQSKFTLARERISSGALDVYASEIEPILKDNKPEDARRLEQQVDRVSLALKEARELGNYASNRMDFLKNARDNAESLISEARNNIQESEKIYNTLNPIVTTALLNHASRKDEIDKRYAPFSNMYNESRTALQVVETEYRSETPDYGNFGDGTAAIETNLEGMKSTQATLSDQFGQLDRSYTRQLADMRIDYFAVIGRTSWDNYSDFSREKNYTYPAKRIDEETFTVLDETGDNAIATVSSRGVRPKIPNEIWTRINLSPTESWPSRSHDAGEFWISDLPVKYFHKYQESENGVTKTSDWVEVDENFFVLHEKNLGMDVYSKPYGKFDDEAITDAVPPGYAFVGNEKYGRWETDSSGRRRWSFLETYAMYHLFFGGSRHYYYHDNWNRWGGRGSYYGPVAGGSSRYGTNSQYARREYANSAYGRTGGFRSAGSSVRGAGRSARGGGPGTRGK